MSSLYSDSFEMGDWSGASKLMASSSAGRIKGCEPNGECRGVWAGASDPAGACAGVRCTSAPVWEGGDDGDLDREAARIGMQVTGEGSTAVDGAHGTLAESPQGRSGGSNLWRRPEGGSDIVELDASGGKGAAHSVSGALSRRKVC